MADGGVIDAAALFNALEPPTVRVPAECRPWWGRLFGLHRVLGPKVYRGRILSHAQFSIFVDDFIAWEEEDLEAEDAEKLFRRYLKAIRIPARAILRLPLSLQVEVMAGFFRCQAAATPATGRRRGRIEEMTRRREATPLAI